MSAIAFIYKCADCGSEFEAAGLSDFTYGLFVMRTEDSQQAFLDAISDAVFEESSEMVERHPQVIGLKPHELGKLTQAVFAVTCDKTLDGGSYEIGMPPKCPSCGSHKMASWQPLRPIRDWPLPSVEHQTWNAKSAPEKIVAIDTAIRRFLAIRAFP